MGSTLNQAQNETKDSNKRMLNEDDCVSKKKIRIVVEEELEAEELSPTTTRNVPETAAAITYTCQNVAEIQELSLSPTTTRNVTETGQ